MNLKSLLDPYHAVYLHCNILLLLWVSNAEEQDIEYSRCKSDRRVFFSVLGWNQKQMQKGKHLRLRNNGMDVYLDLKWSSSYFWA